MSTSLQTDGWRGAASHARSTAERAAVQGAGGKDALLNEACGNSERGESDEALFRPLPVWAREPKSSAGLPVSPPTPTPSPSPSASQSGATGLPCDALSVETSAALLPSTAPPGAASPDATRLDVAPPASALPHVGSPPGAASPSDAAPPPGVEPVASLAAAATSAGVAAATSTGAMPPRGSCTVIFAEASGAPPNAATLATWRARRAFRWIGRALITVVLVLAASVLGTAAINGISVIDATGVLFEPFISAMQELLTPS